MFRDRLLFKSIVFAAFLSSEALAQDTSPATEYSWAIDCMSAASLLDAVGANEPVYSSVVGLPRPSRIRDSYAARVFPIGTSLGKSREQIVADFRSAYTRKQTEAAAADRQPPLEGVRSRGVLELQQLAHICARYAFDHGFLLER